MGNVLPDIDEQLRRLEVELREFGICTATVRVANGEIVSYRLTPIRCRLRLPANRAREKAFKLLERAGVALTKLAEESLIPPFNEQGCPVASWLHVLMHRQPDKWKSSELESENCSGFHTVDLIWQSVYLLDELRTRLLDVGGLEPESAELETMERPAESNSQPTEASANSAAPANGEDEPPLDRLEDGSKAPEGDAIPTTMEPKRSDDQGDNPATFRLLSIYTNGLVDERAEKALAVLNNDALTVDQKLWEIDKLMPIPPSTSAEKLGNAMGRSKRAVQKTSWYIEKRKGQKDNEIGRRHEQHRQRAKQYESDRTRDDD